jgi:hypothetical protein
MKFSQGVAGVPSGSSDQDSICLENRNLQAALNPLQNLPNPTPTYIGKAFLAKIRSQARPKPITTAVAGIAVTQ